VRQRAGPETDQPRGHLTAGRYPISRDSQTKSDAKVTKPRGTNKTPNPLGPVNWWAVKGERVDTQLVHVDRHPTDRSGGVAVNRNPVVVDSDPISSRIGWIGPRGRGSLILQNKQPRRRLKSRDSKPSHRESDARSSTRGPCVDDHREPGVLASAGAITYFALKFIGRFKSVRVAATITNCTGIRFATKVWGIAAGVDRFIAAKPKHRRGLFARSPW